MNELSKKFTTTRARTVTLCKPLNIEDYTPQSAEFASPPKWHLAHTSWFFEEVILKKYVKDYSNFDDNYSYLFNSYYNAFGSRIERDERGLITRPSVDTIFEYRDFVDKHMKDLLDNEHDEAINRLTLLGINHEQQHQELLITDLKYTFSRNPIYPKYTDNNFVENKNETSGWLSINEGLYNIGHQSDSFCYDNELSNHRVFLEPYTIANYLVTNAAFLEFIESGGYTNSALWLDDGWQWLQEQHITHPLYWKKIEGEWFQYTLSGLQPIQPDAILCHVSFYEAAAFAFWKGRRLPTEFEWEVAAEKLNWGSRWEWTNSAYLPYPNFKIADGAIGEYNGKFMINQMVLRGASSVTAKGHSRRTYRNFFHPSTRWQFSGIRLTK